MERCRTASAMISLHVARRRHSAQAPPSCVHAPSLNATASILRTSAMHGGGSRPCLAGVSSCHASVESRERCTRTWAGNHPTQYIQVCPYFDPRTLARASQGAAVSARSPLQSASQAPPLFHPFREWASSRTTGSVSKICLLLTACPERRPKASRCLAASTRPSTDSYCASGVNLMAA